ncbi:hypothetical protein Q7P37_009320 [Cladosporium fusiforme]
MAPRFLVRMASQAAMQKQWHKEDANSDPPPYQHRRSLPPTQELSLHIALSRTLLPDHPPSYNSLQDASTPPPAYRQHQYSHPASEIDLHSFPDESTILVIGAATRQGMHIIERLLEQHYRVRGVVSNSHEAAQTSKYFESKYDRDHFHPWIVPDMTRRGAFDLAIGECTGVVFVSSQPSPIAISRSEALTRVQNALTAAMSEARMTRFVYCSPRAMTAHPSSRTASPDGDRTSVELAIWDCVDGRRPGFALDIGEFVPTSIKAAEIVTNSSD